MSDAPQRNQKGQPGQPGQPGESAQEGPRPKVVIVDDDTEMRELLVSLLRRRGFEVIEAPSGLRLISYLDVDRPDLILLDVKMSWISGYELCRSIKRNPKFQDIPVCFISGLTQADEIEKGMACGASAYITKPIDGDELVDTVRRLTVDRLQK